MIPKESRVLLVLMGAILIIVSFVARLFVKEIRMRSHTFAGNGKLCSKCQRPAVHAFHPGIQEVLAEPPYLMSGRAQYPMPKDQIL